MSDLIKALILGIIEGITEWLPISSTGHMILAEEFLKFSLSHEFLEMFRVVIQLGAILAVIVLYFHRLNPFSMDGGFHLKKSKVQLWSKIIISCIPAGVIGLLFDDKIDKVFYNYQTVAITLILYGIAFIVIENRNKHMKSTINSLRRLDYRTAFLIGIFQVLALIPGTSRSGATILGGIILGTSRLVAAEFTFFLAIPVMFGASLLKILKFGFTFSVLELGVLAIGCVSAFVVSILAIKFLMAYIKQNDFKLFGWYRIVLGIIVFSYFMIIHLVGA